MFTDIVTLIVAALALVGVLWTVRSQEKIAAASSYMTARLNAYTAFEDAMECLTRSLDRADLPALYKTANMAMLVATDSTAAAIGEVQQFLHDCDLRQLPMDFFHKRLELRDAMRADLRTYPKFKKENA